jgi:glutamate/tyrosine decarboxylase-like PLP-dependent enzyme
MHDSGVDFTCKKDWGFGLVHMFDNSELVGNKRHSEQCMGSVRSKVCVRMGVCSLLSSPSVIGINGEVAAGECDSAEAVPDWVAAVWHATGVLGAETVGCRHIDACIAGMAAFFCDSLEKKI